MVAVEVIVSAHIGRLCAKRFDFLSGSGNGSGSLVIGIGRYLSADVRVFVVILRQGIYCRLLDVALLVNFCPRCCQPVNLTR